MTSESPKYQLHGKPVSCLAQKGCASRNRAKLQGPSPSRIALPQSPKPELSASQMPLCTQRGTSFSIPQLDLQIESHSPLILLSSLSARKRLESSICAMPEVGLMSASSYGTHFLFVPQACQFCLSILIPQNSPIHLSQAVQNVSSRLRPQTRRLQRKGRCPSRWRESFSFAWTRAESLITTQFSPRTVCYMPRGWLSVRKGGRNGRS